jgi:FKBP-type peptidyl-prolyl cis-trans isomerase FklB
MTKGKIILVVLILCLASANVFSQKAQIKTKVDSLSYAIGANVGKNIVDNITRDSLPINFELMLTAIKESFASQPLQLADSVIMNILMTFQQERQEVQQKKQSEAASANIKRGQDFLAKNKLDQGVITTASGLQYKVITEGKGRKPLATNKVKVHYHGTTIDGQVFDSSVDRGEPIEFPVNGVIQGWQEALKLMPEGSKWKVFIPSNLAYGDKGAGGKIGPNETLIFEVELLQVIDEPAKDEQDPNNKALEGQKKK